MKQLAGVLKEPHLVFLGGHSRANMYKEKFRKLSQTPRERYRLIKDQRKLKFSPQADYQPRYCNLKQNKTKQKLLGTIFRVIAL